MVLSWGVGGGWGWGESKIQLTSAKAEAKLKLSLGWAWQKYFFLFLLKAYFILLLAFSRQTLRFPVDHCKISISNNYANISNQRKINLIYKFNKNAIHLIHKMEFSKSNLEFIDVLDDLDTNFNVLTLHGIWIKKRRRIKSNFSWVFVI